MQQGQEENSRHGLNFCSFYDDVRETLIQKLYNKFDNKEGFDTIVDLLNQNKYDFIAFASSWQFNSLGFGLSKRQMLDYDLITKQFVYHVRKKRSMYLKTLPLILRNDVANVQKYKLKIIEKMKTYY